MQSWIFSIITLVFTVTWSFRNHSDMLIGCSRNINFFITNVEKVVLLHICFSYIFLVFFDKWKQSFLIIKMIFLCFSWMWQPYIVLHPFFILSYFPCPSLALLPQFLSPLRPQTAAEKVWHLFRIPMITLPKNVNGWKSGNVTRLRIEAWHYGRAKSSGCVQREGEVVLSPILLSQRPGEGYKSAVKSEAPPADWCIIECLFRTFLKALALIILILWFDSGFWPNQKNLCPVRFSHQSLCGWMVFNTRELVYKVKKGNEIMLQRIKLIPGVLAY